MGYLYHQVARSRLIRFECWELSSSPCLRRFMYPAFRSMSSYGDVVMIALRSTHGTSVNDIVSKSHLGRGRT